MSSARPQPRKSRFKYYVIGGLVLLLAAGGAIHAKRKNAGQAVAVTVEKVGRKSVTYRHEFSLAGEPIATGRITAVCCRKGPNGELESVDIPPDVRVVLES